MKKSKKIVALLVTVVAILVAFWLYLNSNNENPPTPNTEGLTEIRVVNNSQDSVLVYLTLGGGFDSTFVQNVNGIFGCSQTGLVGSFWLASNDSVQYTPTLSFSGNLSFGTQPLNCADSTWKTGVNIFEFNLNEPQESIDISCMAGVNCIMRCDLIGGANWLADTCLNARVLQNDTMYNNTGRVGVYPYGCTNCTNTEGKQPCQTPSETPNKYKICNPTRATNEKGGVVRVSFLRYSNWQILK
jgi:hypothetical protein